MIDIKVQFSVQFSGGPQISLSKENQVEAYDKIEVVIEPNNSQVVKVAEGEISFLLIRSNLYTSSSGDIIYKVGTGSDIKLDQPQIFLGTGAVSLLGGNLEEITFLNKYPEPTGNGTNKAEIEILVGRDATP